MDNEATTSQSRHASQPRSQYQPADLAAWTRAVQQLVMFAVEAGFGTCLLVFGPQTAGRDGRLGLLLAAILVAANAALLGRLAKSELLSRRQRTLLSAGLVLGGTAACAGVALAAWTPGWQLLTLAGILWNMELARLVTMPQHRWSQEQA